MWVRYTIQCATPTAARPFSTCPILHTHYQTLSVPPNANKNQIKSSFYRLSKLYHPDVTEEPAAKEKFHAVSEAYAVLGDDRKRRAYDRTLVTEGHGGPSRHATQGYHSHYETSPYEGRRRGATHAWQHPRHTTRPYPRHPHRQGAGGPYQRPSTDPDPTFRDHDLFSFSDSQRTNRREMRHKEHPELNNINNVSSFWRAMQVIGIVCVVAAVGGGFRSGAP